MGLDVLAFKFGGRKEWEQLGRFVYEGFGKCGRDPAACPDCYGKGTVDKDQSKKKTKTNMWSRTFQAKCGTCNGSGKCSECSGHCQRADNELTKKIAHKTQAECDATGKCTWIKECGGLGAYKTSAGKCSECKSPWNEVIPQACSNYYDVSKRHSTKEACEKDKRCKKTTCEWIDCLKAKGTLNGNCSVCGAEWSTGWNAAGNCIGDLALAATAFKLGQAPEDIKATMRALRELNDMRDQASLFRFLRRIGKVGVNYGIAVGYDWGMDILGKAFAEKVTEFLGKDVWDKITDPLNKYRQMDLTPYLNKAAGTVMQTATGSKTLEFANPVEMIKQYAMASLREKFGLGFGKKLADRCGPLKALQKLRGKRRRRMQSSRRRRLLNDPFAHSSGCYVDKKGYSGSIAEHTCLYPVPPFASLVKVIEEQGFKFHYD